MKLPKVYDYSQEKGERRLQELARSGRKERVWTWFVRDDGETAWFDVSDKARKDSVRSIFVPFQKDDTIAEYHTHLDLLTKRDVKRQEEGMRIFSAASPVQKQYMHDVMMLRATLRDHFPSWYDWWHHAEVKSYLGKRDVNVKPSRLVGSYFISSYDCGGKRKKEIENDILTVQSVFPLSFSIR